MYCIPTATPRIALWPPCQNRVNPLSMRYPADQTRYSSSSPGMVN